MDAERATALDIDEQTNRVIITVPTADVSDSVQAFAEQQAVPSDAFEVRVNPHQNQLTSTLLDTWRPTRGGNQLGMPAIPNDYCSQMMNATLTSISPGTRVLITAAHCTTSWGGTSPPTQFTQPLNGTPVANEIIDPGWFNSSFDSRCPTTLNACRYTDAAFAALLTPLDFFGVVGNFHKTTASCTLPAVICTTQVSPTVFQAIGAAPATVVGAWRNKIGAATGWTAGPASASCTTLRVTDIKPPNGAYFVCSDAYSLGVIGGDSGSFVFVQTNDSTILVSGILFGSDGTTSTMYANPLSNFSLQPGNPTFTFCAPGHSC
jgi:hypothetical protein